MNPVHEGGPFKAEGRTVKALAGGRYWSLLRVTGQGYSEQGAEHEAAAVVQVLNAHDPLAEALRELLQRMGAPASQPTPGSVSEAYQQARDVLARHYGVQS